MGKAMDTLNSGNATKRLDEITSGVLNDLRKLSYGEIFQLKYNAKKDTFMWVLLSIVMEEKNW